MSTKRNARNATRKQKQSTDHGHHFSNTFVGTAYSEESYGNRDTNFLRRDR